MLSSAGCARRPAPARERARGKLDARPRPGEESSARTRPIQDADGSRRRRAAREGSHRGCHQGRDRSRRARVDQGIDGALATVSRRRSMQAEGKPSVAAAAKAYPWMAAREDEPGKIIVDVIRTAVTKDGTHSCRGKKRARRAIELPQGHGPASTTTSAGRCSAAIPAAPKPREVRRRPNQRQLQLLWRRPPRLRPRRSRRTSGVATGMWRTPRRHSAR